MKVLLLTRYDRLGASSRVRAFQYLPYFDAVGWQVKAVPFFSNAYLEKLYSEKPRWAEIVRAYWRRIGWMFTAGRYDLLWIEKELFPFFPAAAERLIERRGIPYMADYDDALFHRYDKHPSALVRALLGRKIDAVMARAALVVAGNNYLAERARSAGAKRVEVVPTVVDVNRYADGGSIQKSQGPLVVGWIGTPQTSGYLLQLKRVFQSLQAKFDVRFVAVGAGGQGVGNLPVVAWPWHENTEVESIRQFDIGIMPLADSAWERGKCGYKLIQYMACGLPVVASPVGVNREIVEPGVNGFLAENEEKWRQSLADLLADPALRGQMGRNGRQKVKSWYSLQVQAPRLESLLKQVVK